MAFTSASGRELEPEVVGQVRADQFEDRLERADQEKAVFGVERREVVEHAQNRHFGVVPRAQRLHLNGDHLVDAQVVIGGGLGADQHAVAVARQQVEQVGNRDGAVILRKRVTAAIEARSMPRIVPVMRWLAQDDLRRVAPDARDLLHAVNRQQIVGGQGVEAGDGDGRLPGAGIDVAFFGLGVGRRDDHGVRADLVIDRIFERAVNRARHRRGESGQAEREAHHQQRAPIAPNRAGQFAQRHQHGDAAPERERCAPRRPESAGNRRRNSSVIAQREQRRRDERQRIAERVVGGGGKPALPPERVQDVERRDQQQHVEVSALPPGFRGAGGAALEAGDRLGAAAPREIQAAAGRDQPGERARRNRLRREDDVERAACR